MFPIGDDDTSRRTVPLVTYAQLGSGSFCSFSAASVPLPMLRIRAAWLTWRTSADSSQGLC